MANLTDPLVISIQGSDPQNLMEYITRQKIYDSRYWKEECFGLSVVDVLEKGAKQLVTIGGFPTKFLCLCLKLLQLQPETELVIESFIQQEDFKYVRALGLLYLRLTGRPQTIYETLEPLYVDYRKLRCLEHQTWSLLHMDEWVHQLLRSNHVLGITLPRLPSRETLEEAAFLEEYNDIRPTGLDSFTYRPTALKDALQQHGCAGCPHEYLRFKVEQGTGGGSQAALELYRKRKKNDLKVLPLISHRDNTTHNNNKNDKKSSSSRKRSKNNVTDDTVTTGVASRAYNTGVVDHKDTTYHHSQKEKPPKDKKKKKKNKHERNYDNLFKKNNNNQTNKEPEKHKDGDDDEHSEEYWNEQRAKLGLKPLK